MIIAIDIYTGAVGTLNVILMVNRAHGTIYRNKNHKYGYQRILQKMFANDTEPDYKIPHYRSLPLTAVATSEPLTKIIV